MERKQDDEIDARVLAARREVSERLDRVRESVRREFGGFPRGAYWLVPVAAFAVGLVLGLKTPTPRRRRINPPRDV